MKATLKKIVYLFLFISTLSFTVYKSNIDLRQLYSQNPTKDVNTVSYTNVSFKNEYSLIGCWKFHIETCDFGWEIKEDKTLIFDFNCLSDNGSDYNEWDYKQNTFYEITEKGTRKYNLQWKTANSFVLKSEGLEFVVTRTRCKGTASIISSETDKSKVRKKTNLCQVCGGSGRIEYSIATNFSCFTNSELLKMQMSDPHKITCCTCLGTGSVSY